MNVDNLVRMANSIGEFFEAMPDRDAALHGISDHMRMFWAPPMREALSVHSADNGEAGGMKAIVVEALGRYPIIPQAVPLEANDPRPAAERHQWDGASES